MSIFFYLLAVWGLTHILVSSKIFSNLRNWLLINIPFIGEMLQCYQCTSFWVSMFMYFLFDGLEIGIKAYPILDYIVPVIWGFIGSGIMSWVSVLFSYFIKIAKTKKDI